MREGEDVVDCHWLHWNELNILLPSNFVCRMLNKFESGGDCRWIIYLVSFCDVFVEWMRYYISCPRSLTNFTVHFRRQLAVYCVYCWIVMLLCWIVGLHVLNYRGSCVLFCHRIRISRIKQNIEKHLFHSGVFSNLDKQCSTVWRRAATVQRMKTRNQIHPSEI